MSKSCARNRHNFRSLRELRKGESLQGFHLFLNTSDPAGFGGKSSHSRWTPAQYWHQESVVLGTVLVGGTRVSEEELLWETISELSPGVAKDKILLRMTSV